MDVSPHWEDVNSNNRQQLIQMHKDLEIPIIVGASEEELKMVALSRLNPNDQVLREQVEEIYKEERRNGNTFLFIIRLIIYTSLAFGVLHNLNKYLAPIPYCDNNMIHNGCKKCPRGAECKGGSAFCGDGEYISKIGCVSIIKEPEINVMIMIANYISQRQGDCIEKLPDLRIGEFKNIFPFADIQSILNEEELGIRLINGTFKSVKPQITLICRAINYIEENRNIAAPIIIIMFGVFINYKVKARKNSRMEKAKEIAKSAHRILASTDKEVYIYDLKVQLRDKFKNLDPIWKYIVRYIENDSHVLVGFKGVRREAYWKWTHEY